MACFIVPLTLAVIVSIVKRISRGLAEKINLGMLEVLLWGGAGLLALEHIWHGEVVPWPPFLTAMQNPEEWSIALHEMATNGVAMTIATSALWAGVQLINRKLGISLHREAIEKRITTTISTEK
jgi:hypothetical protein